MAVRQLYTEESQTTAGGRGGLANIYKPADGRYGYVNVTKDYPWTISENAKLNAGRVILKEYQVNESTIKRQTLFYTTGLNAFAEAATNPAGFLTAGPGDTQINDVLRPYENLFPKDMPTGFVYDFPYFDGINFELYSEPWASLDILETFQKVGQTFSSLVTPGEGLSKATKTAIDAFKLATAGVGAGLAAAYPKVGIMDRPRLWQGHNAREINLVVPLYNTLSPEDWENNRQLCELLINQNLYNKRDFITSIPPVFYEVLAIGQHYSWASCVTKITIYNKGNIRQLTDRRGISCNVPDVYEINLTLTDMVMQSKNLFQSLKNPVVTSSIVQSEFIGGSNVTSAQNAIPGALAPGLQSAGGTLQSIYNSVLSNPQNPSPPAPPQGP